MKIDFEELPEGLQFIFLAVGQSAVRASDLDMTKEQFVEFCSEMWVSMEIEPHNFKAVLRNAMHKDLMRFASKAKSSKHP